MTAPAIPVDPAATVQVGYWLPLERAMDPRACGGKAAALGRLLRAGLPVPPGIVLTTHAFERFLREADLVHRMAALESRAAHADAVALERIERDARAWIDAAPMPQGVLRQSSAIVRTLAAAGALAVRSSALGEDDTHASCAGLLRSVLSVPTDEQALERAIKAVWASRWSARALAYANTGRGSLQHVAVIVQAQIDAACAGVLFTRSPEPGREAQMLCEYCEGLADRLVSGAVTPARLAIDRGTLRRCDPAAGDEACPPLEEGTIEALATAALAAERLFGSPQDIEWALDGDARLWVVQSRPITAPAMPSSPRRIVWSNANVNENFPEPITPFLYSVVGPGYTHYFANLGRAFGFSRRRMARMAGDIAAIVGVHAGRLYYNLTAIHAVLREAPFGRRLVAWFDDFTGASDPASEQITQAPKLGASLRDAIELASIAGKTLWQYLFIDRRVRRFESGADAFAERSRPSRLARMNALELRDLIRAFIDIRMQRWTDASLADAAAMVCYGLLKAVVGRALEGTTDTASHNALLQGLTGLRSAEPVQALWALAARVRNDPLLNPLFKQHAAADIPRILESDTRFAEFHRAFQDYLERWGFRCSGELMLTVPSFQEAPELLIEIIRNCAADCEVAPQSRLAEQQRARAAATRTVMAAARRRPLVWPLSWPSYALVLAPLLRATQASIGLRERARLKQALLYSRLRRVALEIGSRLVADGSLLAREDIFYLTVSEVDELLSARAMFPQQVPALVALRRSAHASFSDERPSDVLTAAEGRYPSTAPARESAGADDDALRGSSVCGGVATGTARVLGRVAETRLLKRGDVLVTRQTDPGWAPAFVTIGALVLERGGMLSHGAILAREYGIPTLVGVTSATRRIADASIVRVDADCGEIHVVSR